MSFAVAGKLYCSTPLILNGLIAQAKGLLKKYDWERVSQADKDAFLAPLDIVDSKPTSINAFLGVSLLARDISLLPALTHPTSKSDVFMVRSGKARMGEIKTVAVLKVFHESFEDFYQELVALDHLEKNPIKGMKPVRIQSLFKYSSNGKISYAILMDAAQGSDLEQLFKRPTTNRPAKIKSLLLAMENMGLVLSRFHERFQTQKRPEKQSKLLAYEKNRLGLLLRDDAILEKYIGLGWLAPTERDALKVKIKDVIDSYTENEIARTSLFHGECDLANVVYHPSGLIQWIDVHYMVKGMDVHEEPVLTGGGDPNTDVGRFLASTEIYGLVYKMSPDEIEQFKEAFLRGYFQGDLQKRVESENAILFHRLRLYSVILEKNSEDRIKKEEIQKILQKLLQELEIRQSAEAISKKLDRGDAAAHVRYYDGMDVTSQQKTALANAFLPEEGILLDFGCGSGFTTRAITKLNPKVKAVGLDLNHETVKYAQTHHQDDRTSFAYHDVSQPYMADGTVDVVMSYSTQHEVVSFSGYNIDKARQTTKSVYRQLKEGGLYIMRDFVIPHGPNLIYLDLPTQDGEGPGGVIPKLSSSALFELFAREFRASIYPKGGIRYRKLKSPIPGFVRYEVEHRIATEFVLRKDYRTTPEQWYRELEEQYLYFSQEDFESDFFQNGFRILLSKPIYNPWIQTNRFEDKFYFSDLKGNRLPYPASNFIIIGQKVGPNRGIRIAEQSYKVLPETNYLKIKSYKHKATGIVYDTIQRPGRTYDVVPWFEQDGVIYVMHRQEYPRPISSLTSVEPSLNRTRHSGYISEPVVVVVPERESDEQAIQKALESQVGIKPSDVLKTTHEAKYYPSPGGIAELAQGRLVQVRPKFDRRRLPLIQGSFSDRGFTRPANAVQLLHSFQVGGMYDSRLEIMIYQLFLKQSRGVGPWIGAKIDLKEQVFPQAKVFRAKDIFASEPVQSFEETNEIANYLDVRVGTFAETRADGRELGRVELEYTIPRSWSRNTVTGLPVVKSGGKYYVGLERRELPTPQIFEGSSVIIAGPAFRVPKYIEDLESAQSFMKEGFEKHFKLKVARAIPLGGDYYTSTGNLPELAYAHLVEADVNSLNEADLLWVELGDLLANLDRIRDGHLLTSTLRLAHAVGLLKR